MTLEAGLSKIPTIVDEDLLNPSTAVRKAAEDLVLRLEQAHICMGEEVLNKRVADFNALRATSSIKERTTRR